MAVMTSPQRAACAGKFQQSYGAGESIAVNKTDVRAALDAVDQWVSDNAASFNTALPTAFKNNATASQKARLLQYVVAERYLNGT